MLTVWTAAGSKDRIFMGAFASVFVAAASFLFDHQITPVSTARSAVATRSPVDFTDYLLLHQVATPRPTTLNGKTQTLSQKTSCIRRAVRSSGRSSGGLGRMEINSSSEASQLTALAIRSRLSSGREPTRLFCPASDVPITTKRPCEGPWKVPAAARVSGPLRPFFGSTAPCGPMEVVARLSSVVSTSFETVVLSVALASRERAKG